MQRTILAVAWGWGCWLWVLCGCGVTVLAVMSDNNNTSHYQLRFDWTHLPPRSALAQRISRAQQQTRSHQEDDVDNYCHRAADAFRVWRPPNGGLGMNLHVWAAHLCGALEHDQILVPWGRWKWAGPECHRQYGPRPFLCYFGDHVAAARACPTTNNATTAAAEWEALLEKAPSPPMEQCPTFIRPDQPVRSYMAAAAEYLFQSVRPAVVAEAEAQVRAAFPQGLPLPHHLVTIHMRWGDKGKETPLLPASHFVRGARALIDRAGNIPATDTHVYLASEDPDAIAAFRRAAPSHWRVHTSGPEHAPGASKAMAGFRSGPHGLSSLAALLVALQADHYVLVTVSNWSRLINELRLNVVDPRCGGCTTVRDLHYGEWPTLHPPSLFGREHYLSWGSDFGRPLYWTWSALLAHAGLCALAAALATAVVRRRRRPRPSSPARAPWMPPPWTRLRRRVR